MTSQLTVINFWMTASSHERLGGGGHILKWEGGLLVLPPWPSGAPAFSLSPSSSLPGSEEQASESSGKQAALLLFPRLLSYPAGLGNQWLRGPPHLCLAKGQVGVPTHTPSSCSLPHQAAPTDVSPTQQSTPDPGFSTLYRLLPPNTHTHPRISIALNYGWISVLKFRASNYHG